MHSTLDALKSAVLAGQMSVIDYYVEADNVYGNISTYLGGGLQEQAVALVVTLNLIDDPLPGRVFWRRILFGYSRVIVKFFAQIT